MEKREDLSLCCIGGGKMGEALIQGFLAAGVFRAGQIVVVDIAPARRERFEKGHGVRSTDAVTEADIYILAVKPQDMEKALGQLKVVLTKQALIVSIAAGISSEWILARLGQGCKVVRTMPNAPALMQMSATGLYFGSAVDPEEKEFVLQMFRAVGMAVDVEREEDLDVITGLSGSGPGYVFLLLEAFSAAGAALGLSMETAERLALQTFLGSAMMARETGKTFVSLREMISSPGGTTLAGLKVFEDAEIRELVRDVVEAATRRARELRR